MKRDELTEAVRQRLRKLPPPHDSHYGVVPLPPPEDGLPLDTVAGRLSTAETALGRIDTLAAELKDPYLISRILPRREAVSSSSIEGTHSTLDELLSVEAADSEDVSGDTRQVRDYALALDRFLPRARNEKHEVFDTELVRDLHRAVMTGDRDYKDEPGEFRDRAVWIGGSGHIAHSTYNPTPPEDIAASLEDTMSYLRCEGVQAMNQSLIARMAIAHAHFEAVHPFRDGNGRVGRLLLPLMMAAEGRTPLYLAPYIEAHKTAYYDSLKAAQQKLQWHEAVGFLADAILGTTEELLATREALIRLGEIWNTRRKFRKGSTALNAIGLLPHYPVLTVSRLGGLLNVSVPAASQAVAQLMEVGIITERTAYARNRVFAATEALAIVNRPFGETPILPGQTG